jgi:hypothetical protein
VNSSLALRSAWPEPGGRVLHFESAQVDGLGTGLGGEPSDYLDVDGDGEDDDEC